VRYVLSPERSFMPPRPARRMLPLAVVATLAASLALPAGQAAAASYKTCSVKGKERKLGTTYVTKLRARGTSCKTAERVVRAFHACRHKKGKAGRCTRKVKGYRCTDKRKLVMALSYDSDATCTSGSKGVKFSYQQNT
jgi:hypothetical protein